MPTRRHRARRKIARHTPKSMIEYPFEVSSAIYGVSVGLPVTFGFTDPASLISTVGQVISALWALSLLLGGISVAVGVARRNWLVIASGLALLGSSAVVYAIAIAVNNGFGRGWVVAAYMTVLAVISFARANHFRRIVDLQENGGNE